MSLLSPPPEIALRIFRERFLHRTDMVSFLAPWGKPSPATPGEKLDELLLGHLLGEAAPAARISYRNRHGVSAARGHFRVGAYALGRDHTTRWLCLDFDGEGHASPLADPQGTAVATQAAFGAAGLVTHLERSGGGHGWHLWCFFDPPIPAEKARALGYALAPGDAPLATGARRFADPRLGLGIEVFPKQDRLRRGQRGVGGAIWLPWWHGAPSGANVFYRVGADGLAPYAPTELEPADPHAVDRVLSTRVSSGAAINVPAQSTRAAGQDKRTIDEPAWADWRRRALETVPLERVYGEWLTGKTRGGWLECRDPSSSTGDRHPSAGVADGSGEALRGTFYSFRSGKSLSLFDFLVEYGGVADFRAARQQVAELAGIPEPARGGETPPVRAHPAPPRRPRVLIHHDEHVVVDEAIDALAHVDGVYRRGPLLVHVVDDRNASPHAVHPGGGLSIYSLGPAGVREQLARAAEWYATRETAEGVMERRIHPPMWLVSEVEARKQWPQVPRLDGVVDSPVLRPDGSVLEAPGYDAATFLFFAPQARYPPLPSCPTRDDAAVAAAELLDLVVDFPFQSDVDRVAWLAALITPFARYAFEGPAPLFLIDANVRAAGKTLLADVIGELVFGRPMPRTVQATDETEEIKRITAVAIDGTRLMLLDNINRPLGSAPLDTVLTGTRWTERILGRSEKVELPMLTVWYGTGNNVTFAADTARRTLRIRLDSHLERPELRDGFRHPALLAWARQHRRRLVTGVLTLLRAYCAAGTPAMNLKPWGSYEGWSRRVRSAIVWAGLPDPCAVRGEVEQVDTEKSALADLLAGWLELPYDWGRAGCTVARALDILYDDNMRRQYGRLRAALSELCPHPPGQLPTAQRVGLAMRRFLGRVQDGASIRLRVLRGSNLWFVESNE